MHFIHQSFRVSVLMSNAHEKIKIMLFWWNSTYMLATEQEQFARCFALCHYKSILFNLLCISVSLFKFFFWGGGGRKLAVSSAFPPALILWSVPPQRHSAGHQAQLCDTDMVHLQLLKDEVLESKKRTEVMDAKLEQLSKTKNISGQCSGLCFCSFDWLLYLLHFIVSALFVKTVLWLRQ